MWNKIKRFFNNDHNMVLQYLREQMLASGKPEVIKSGGDYKVTFFIKDLCLTVELIVLDRCYFQYTIYDENNTLAFKIGCFHCEGRADFYKNLCDYIWYVYPNKLKSNK